MASPMMITMKYSGSKKDVAEFVAGRLQASVNVWQSITIIRPERLEAYCVHIAIDTSSVEIVEVLAQSYCLERMDI